MEGSELYGLPAEQFTAARNELVKRLRADGQREKAASVARLRKPPATASALNHLARESPETVGAVFDAGTALRDAMDAALGGDASGVRAARAAEREAVTAAVAAAGRYLGGAGHGANDGARRRIETTLRAAMVDTSAAEALRQGVLDRDYDAPGFGFSEQAEPAPADAGRARRAGPAGGAGAKDAKRQAAAEQAAAEEAARQAAARQAKLIGEADRLERRAEELGAAATDAEAVAFRARRAADEAKAEAADARRRAEDAATADD